MASNIGQATHSRRAVGSKTGGSRRQEAVAAAAEAVAAWAAVVTVYGHEGWWQEVVLHVVVVIVVVVVVAVVVVLAVVIGIVSICLSVFHGSVGNMCLPWSPFCVPKYRVAAQCTQRTAAAPFPCALPRLDSPTPWPGLRLIFQNWPLAVITCRLASGSRHMGAGK